MSSPLQLRSAIKQPIFPPRLVHSLAEKLDAFAGELSVAFLVYLMPHVVAGCYLGGRGCSLFGC